MSKTATAKKTTAAPAKKSYPMPEGFAVGMKVKSSKDGLTYEVTGPDPSIAYVKVKGADGKTRARSVKTLTPIKARARKA